MKNTIDASLVNKYRLMAAQGDNFRGLSILSHAPRIGELIAKTGSRTVLDYGSGRGDAYNSPHSIQSRWSNAVITLYDPAFDAHATKPERHFDGVICSDVLEHIPQRMVLTVLEELFTYADKFVWMSVCCRLAKKHFDDGRNMHVTVKPFAWWKKMVDSVDRKSGKYLVVELVETP